MNFIDHSDIFTFTLDAPVSNDACPEGDSNDRLRIEDHLRSWAVADILAIIKQAYDETERIYRRRFEQLSPNQKTTMGSLVESSVRDRYDLGEEHSNGDGHIDGLPADIKFSTSGEYKWMIAQACRGRWLVLLSYDQKKHACSFGFAYAHESILNPGSNGDKKKTISKAGREAVTWIFRDHRLVAEDLTMLLPV